MPKSLHDSATLYSLGLLDAQEVPRFEDHLAVDPKLAALVRDLHELSGAILTTDARQNAVLPSSILKTRIMNAILTIPQHRFPIAVLSALAEARLAIPKPGVPVAFANEDGILDWVSPGFERMCGFELAEMRGLKAGSRLRGELSHPEAKERLHNAVLRRLPVVQRIINYRKNGTPYLVEIDLRPVAAGFVAMERELPLAA